MAFVFQETGDALLLEDGDNAVKESGAVARRVLLGLTDGLGNIGLNTSITGRTIATTSGAGFVEIVAPMPGIFRNLACRLTVAPGGIATRTVTLVRNDVATDLAVTFGSGDTVESDELDDVPIKAGDRLYLALTVTSSPATSDLYWSLEWESYDTRSSWYGSATGTAQSGFIEPFTGKWHASAASATALIPCDGTITQLTAANTISGVSSSAGLTYFVYLNGVKQLSAQLTISNVAVNQAVSSTFSLPVGRGDELTIGIEETGTYPSSWTAVSMVFEAETDGQSVLATFAGGNPNSSAVNYHGLGGWGEGSQQWLSSVSNDAVRKYGGPTAFSLGHLILKVTDAPGASKTRTFDLMKNGAAEAPTGIITNASLLIDDDQSATFEAGDIVGPLRHTPSGGPTITGDEYWSLIMAQTLVEDPEEEETPIEGINPDPGDPTGDLHFIRIKIGATVYMAADALIRDGSSTYDGKKIATLLRISANERALSRDGWTASTFSVRVTDIPDPASFHRLWRGRMKSVTIEQALIEVYRCSAPHGTIEGKPFRLMAGVVKPGGFKASSGFVFDFECVDLLGDRFANPLNQPNIPTYRLNQTDIVNLVPESDGKYLQRVIGDAVEEGIGCVPMVPAVFDVNLNDLLGGGAANVDVDVWLLSEGAVYDIEQGYQNLLIWGADQVVLAKDLIRATPASTDPGIGFVWVAQNDGTTGATEPAWPASGTVNDNGITWAIAGPYDPLVRFPIPTTSYSDFLTHPFAPNWTTATGLTEQYVDYPLLSGTRRLIPVFTVHDHRNGQALREKRMTLLFDVVGARQSAGSGAPILRFTYAIMRLLIDYIFTPTDLTTYGDIPVYDALDGPYSIFDTESADAAEVIGEDEGAYTVGFVLAADGQQQGLWQWVGAMLRGGSLRIGPNRHGQVHFARKPSPETAPVITFRPHRTILDSSYVADGSRRATSIEFRYGKRYADPFVTAPAPSVGDNLPAASDVRGWASGLVRSTNQAAFDALWETHAALLPPLKFDNLVTRDKTTAGQAAERELDDATGPGPAYHGTLLFTLQGPIAELLLRPDSNDKTRELGDVIGIIDDEGPSEDGETLERGWITKIRIDPEADTCTLSGELLADS